MALTPLSGSSTSSSPPTVPFDNNIPNTQSDILPNMPFVTDPALNKYANDTTQYVNATRELAGFIKGKRQIVTYYRLLNAEGPNNRTNVADMVTARNITNLEYQKIELLEITLPKGFEFTSNTAQASVTLAGEAMFYPGMNPSVGDIFLMGTGDGRIGVCRISQVDPTNWRQDHIYAVRYFVQEFLTAITDFVLNGAVTITSVFDKANYLGGTSALLSEQTYVQLGQIRALRGNLCKFYHQTFFDPNMGSYVRPDTLYDPWCTQFMVNKLSMKDVNILPKNLLGRRPELYNQTIWARLEDSYNATLYGVAPYTNTLFYEETRSGVFNTELYGHQILFPGFDPVSGTPYIFTTNFYSGLLSAMTPDEVLFYTAITQRTVGDLTLLITLYLNTVWALTPDQQYYKIPLYIHLMDMAMKSQYREIDAPSMNYAPSGG